MHRLPLATAGGMFRLCQATIAAISYLRHWEKDAPSTTLRTSRTSPLPTGRSGQSAPLPTTCRGRLAPFLPVKKQGLLYRIRTCELTAGDDFQPVNGRFQRAKGVSNAARAFWHGYCTSVTAKSNAHPC